MLVVMLKSLVPQHIKAQFRTRMQLLRCPPTRTNFVWYLLNELTEEIKAQEANLRKMTTGAELENREKAKEKSPKVFGCFYLAHKSGSPCFQKQKVRRKGRKWELALWVKGKGNGLLVGAVIAGIMDSIIAGSSS